MGEKLLSSIVVDQDYANDLLEMPADESGKLVKEMAMARIRNSPPNKILESFVQMYIDVRAMAKKFYNE